MSSAVIGSQSDHGGDREISTTRVGDTSSIANFVGRSAKVSTRDSPISGSGSYSSTTDGYGLAALFDSSSGSNSVTTSDIGSSRMLGSIRTEGFGSVSIFAA